MGSDPKRFEGDFADGRMNEFGTFYPLHYIVAVVRDPAAAANAAAALVAAGFGADDVTRFSGAQVLDHHHVLEDREHQHRGLLERLGELFPADEAQVMNEYLDDARAGATIVTVYAPQQDQQHRASTIIKSYGGFAVRYYGERSYTDL